MKVGDLVKMKDDLDVSFASEPSYGSFGIVVALVTMDGVSHTYYTVHWNNNWRTTEHSVYLEKVQ